ncbi:MAG: efflux RND transporter permease subunit, partial [Bacteroidia bacterium]|nr:efflux RND transporter permease subunit [Bacteroidia bacterium]
MIGNIMREFSLVVVVSTLMSLVVSFTITPMLASRFSRYEELTKDTLMGRLALLFENSFRWLVRQYEELLVWSLRNKLIVSVITIALFFGSFTLITKGFIGSEFVAQPDKGQFSVSVELPASASLEKTNAMALQIERMIASIPEVEKILTNVGASNDGFLVQSSNNVAEMTINLVDASRRKRTTNEVSSEIRRKIQEIPGIKVRVSPIGIFGSANQTPIMIIVSNNNRELLKQAAEQVMDIVRNTKGATDVRLSSEEGKPETRIEFDRDKMAAFGLNIADVGATLRAAFLGDDNTKFRVGDNEHNIRIVFDQFDRSKVEDVGSITFLTPTRKLVELKQFATIYQTNGPSKLSRENRNTSITVLSQVMGRPSGTVSADIDQVIKKTKLPPGTSIVWEGDAKNQNQSFGDMGLAMIAAILFVYMIMVALYDSYIYPFVVLFSIPVSVVGALLALALTMSTLSIFSMLGMIMLIGLVAKNAILLVDFTNQLKATGLDTYHALIEAGKERLRPILMTTVAMVVGMIPIAISNSPGSEFKKGLGWVLIGGLSSSMLLTLVVVPIVFYVVDKIKDKVLSWFGVTETTNTSEPEPVL